MEYRVIQLQANIATGHVFAAHWTLTYTDGGFTAYRYGSVAITPEPTPLVYAGLDESTAIERVKDALGEEFIEQLEASVIAEVAALQAPTIIEGVPWLVDTPTPPAP